MSQKTDRLSIHSMCIALTILRRSLRRSVIPDNADITLPQSQKDDYILFGNSTLRRKRIVLLAPACTIATCTMCPLPNEALDVRRRTITSGDIIKQFEASFKKDKVDDYELITIYNNGNFFADCEIPPKVRQHIYRQVYRSKASILTVESLPQFINAEKMTEARKYLGDKQLAVVIGLQSANDLVRELAINSTCTKAAFERAINLLKENNYIPLAFLMIKPPFLTEKEAIEDSIGSIQYLSSLNINNPILCATKVAPNTILRLLYLDGRFRPPWLWTIIEILRRSSKICPDSMPGVAISELKIERNLDSICAQNCTKCSNFLTNAIEKFNIARDFKPFEKFRCNCYEDYQRFLFEEDNKLGCLPLRQRVALFLRNHKQTSHTNQQKL